MLFPPLTLQKNKIFLCAVCMLMYVWIHNLPVVVSVSMYCLSPAFMSLLFTEGVCMVLHVWSITFNFNSILSFLSPSGSVYRGRGRRRSSCSVCAVNKWLTEGVRLTVTSLSRTHIHTYTHTVLAETWWWWDCCLWILKQSADWSVTRKRKGMLALFTLEL